MRISIAITTIVAVFMVSRPAGAAPLLWNTLGSATEVQNSGFGPDLTFYGGGDPFGEIANPAYTPGMFGNALTIGPGSYTTPYRIYNVIWNNVDQHLNANRGTIEAWYKQVVDPVGFSHGVYRIFDGAYGLGSGVALDAQAATNSLNFGVQFGGTYVGVQSNVSAYNGTWIHLAGVWDRDGIDGSFDTVRLYVNGSVVASTTSSAWGSMVGQRADIAGGNDGNIAGKFAVDNLKVYDIPMTDFSNRFDESSLPEPSCAALLAGVVLALRRRHRA